MALNLPFAFPSQRKVVHNVQRTLRRRLPAVFRLRLIVDRRGVEPRLPGCKPSVLPIERAARLYFSFAFALASSLARRAQLKVRPGIEPGLGHRPTGRRLVGYHSGVPPKHLQTMNRLEARDPRREQAIARLRHQNPQASPSDRSGSRSLRKRLPHVAFILAIARRRHLLLHKIATLST